MLTCTPTGCWLFLHSPYQEPNQPQPTSWPHTDGLSAGNQEPWCSLPTVMLSTSPHILMASVRLVVPVVSFAGATTTSVTEPAREAGQKWRAWRSTQFLCWPPAAGWEKNTLASHSFWWATVWEASLPWQLPWTTLPTLTVFFWQVPFCTGNMKAAYLTWACQMCYVWTTAFI